MQTPPTKSVSRSIGIVALAAACPVSLAQPTLSDHRWWNPDGAPVSGGFATSANWAGFVLPITDGSRINNLKISGFDSPADFVAENNLQSGLEVGRLTVGDSGTASRIGGLPIRLRSYRSAQSTTDPSMFARGTVTLETPLRGSDPMTLFVSGGGTLVLDPNGSGPHDFSGGFIQTGPGTVEVDRGAALGSLSNSYTLVNGTFRATDSFTLGIPVSVPSTEGEGTQQAVFDTPSGVQLTLSAAFSGDGDAEKTGPGTLVAVGDGSGAAVDWNIAEGRADVAGSGLGSESRLTLQPGATVRLVGDAGVSAIENGSFSVSNGTHVELNGHTLTVSGVTDNQSAISGPGTFRIADGGSVIFQVLPASAVYGYTLHADGVVEINDSRTFSGTPFGAIVIGPDGLVTGDLVGTAAVFATGTLGGGGRLESSRFRFGSDDSSGTYGGVLENTALCIKQGSGRYTLTGDNEITGDLVIEEGELVFAAPQAVGTPDEIEIRAGAQLSLTNGCGVGRVVGPGAVGITGTATIGEDGSDSALEGPLLGTLSSTLRKRGDGTMTLRGDTAGFQGFLDVLGGTCEFEDVSLVPNGSVFANGLATLRGAGEIASDLLVQNLLSVTPGATLRLTGAGKRNFGLFEAPPTSVLVMDAVTVMQDGNGPFGTISADGGAVRLGDNTEITDGTVEAINGGTIELAGHAVLRDASIRGSIARLAGGGLELDNSGLTLAPGDTVSVILDAGDAGADPVIAGTGSAALAGTLHLAFAEGFTPVTGDRFAIVGGAAPADIAVSGAFDAVIAPDLSSDLGADVLRLNETPTGVEAVVTCPADFAQPYGILDLSDINSFVSGFQASDPAVDLDENGILDLADIGLFIAVVVKGCP